jgi:hypothetical protein
MTKKFRALVGAAVGAVVALGFSSCTYDPNYSSASVGGTYSTGGYGYGGSRVSSSVFISTGDPSWGYDPNCYSYYDYRSRRYYDPYLYGYYPVGYRPPVVYGAPHPYGWRPGGGYIRPPVRVTNVIIPNYQNREYRYRNSNYGWAKQVRSEPQGGRYQSSRPSQGTYDNRNDRNSQTTYSRPNTGSRPSTTYSRDSQSRYQGGQAVRGSTRTDTRTQNNNGRLPSRYNTPVASPQQQTRQGQRTAQSNKNYRAQTQGARQNGARSQKEKQSDEEMKRSRNYR